MTSTPSTAFEHGAVDYLMKPVTAARLSTACNRVRERLATKPANLDALVAKLADAVANRRAYLRWINVESGPNVRLVTVEEICYFQADTKYTRLVTADRESLIRMSLKELLDVLDPAEFWQIHRSVIVNVNAIAEVSRDARGHPKLHLKNRNEALAGQPALRASVPPDVSGNENAPEIRGVFTLTQLHPDEAGPTGGRCVPVAAGAR